MFTLLPGSSLFTHTCTCRPCLPLIHPHVHPPHPHSLTHTSSSPSSPTHTPSSPSFSHMYTFLLLIHPHIHPPPPHSPTFVHSPLHTHQCDVVHPPLSCIHTLTHPHEFVSTPSTCTHTLIHICVCSDPPFTYNPSLTHALFVSSSSPVFTHSLPLYLPTHPRTLLPTSLQDGYCIRQELIFNHESQPQTQPGQCMQCMISSPLCVVLCICTFMYACTLHGRVHIGF